MVHVPISLLIPRPLHWVAVVANATVHVFMYYYFSLSALGVNVWWKKFLTGGQLVQFSLVFFCIQAWMYFSFANFRFTCVSLAPPLLLIL